MAGYRSTGWQLKALEQHRLLRLQNARHPSRTLQTLKASLLCPVMGEGGELEVEGAGFGLCWEPKQEPAVVVARPVDQLAAAVQFAARGMHEGMDKDGVGVVDEHIGLETCGVACYSRREVAAADREVGPASWRIARSFADDLGTQKYDQLSLDACACTACK